MRIISTLALGILLPLAACSDDDKGSTDTTTTTTTDTSGGDTGGDVAADVTLPAGCTVLLEPGANDAETIQTAFIEASSGDTICLAPGTYALDRELSLANAADVTLKGTGATRDEVVLDFATQTIGDDGVTVTATGFVIENLWVKNSPGNGVVAHSELSTFRNIKVSWDAGSVTENGFYAVYPTDCKKAIIEDCEVTGASDAGIYVGSCEYAIVRRNEVHGNVAGLEIENTVHADVYENEVYDNTAGILMLLLPKLKIKENRYVLVRDNIIHDNNRLGFATGGTVVSYVPYGIGVLVLAGADIEIRDNTMTDNKGTAVMAVSFKTFEILTDRPLTDPDLDPFLHRLYVHDNTMTGNGTSPEGTLSLFGQATLENVLWDGVLKEGETLDDAKVCLGTTPTSFRNIAIEAGFAVEAQSTDTTGHTCTLEGLPEMEDFSEVTP